MERQRYEEHDLADLVPEMCPEEYAALVEDIAEHGVREPITLFEGKIIDGRHRLRAVDELEERGVRAKYTVREFKGTRREAEMFVLSENLCRRHLTFSQRAALAVEMKQVLQAGGRPKGWVRPEEQDGEQSLGESATIAANRYQVGSRAVYEAEKILRGAPDLWEVMRDGGIELRDAQRELKRREEAYNMAVEAKAAKKLSEPTIRQLKPTEWLKLLDKESVDLLITDTIAAHAPEGERIWEYVDGIVHLALSRVKPCGRAYFIVPMLPKVLAAWFRHLLVEDERHPGFALLNLITVGHRPVQRLRSDAYGLSTEAVLYVAGPKAGNLRSSNIWELQQLQNFSHLHVPRDDINEKLIERLIRQGSLPDDIVIDPMAVNPVVLLTAHRLGRRSAGATSTREAIQRATDHGCTEEEGSI